MSLSAPPVDPEDRGLSDAPKEHVAHRWVDVCDIDTVEIGRGVRALVAGHAVALFRVGGAPDGTAETVWAIGDFDPCTGASVLSRGLIGSRSSNGEIQLYVASPLRKHRFALADGVCLDDPSSGAGAWAVRVKNGRIWVRTEPVVVPSWWARPHTRHG